MKRQKKIFRSTSRLARQSSHGGDSSGSSKSSSTNTPTTSSSSTVDQKKEPGTSAHFFKPTIVVDTFVPRPSPLTVRYCRDDNALPSDRDIWVEAYYTSSTTQRPIPYYRSVRTGACRKVEPPTGAQICVGLSQTGAAGPPSSALLAAVAQQPVSKDDIRAMPAPRVDPNIIHRVLSSSTSRNRTRFWLRK